MKAVVFYEHGGPEVLCYEEVPRPSPGPGEALIRVRAVSVNRTLDGEVRARGANFPLRFPHILGPDPAGEVVALGEEIGAARMEGDRLPPLPLGEGGGEGASSSPRERRADPHEGRPHPDPLPLGEGIGRAAGLGAAESAIRVGQRVVVHHVLHCGQCPACRAGNIHRCPGFGVYGVHRPGGNAEYAVAPVRNLLPIPDELSDVEAAALMVTYPTAWHLLATRGAVQAVG
jgi:NADPH:quinone reductase-like Zn-dependent oxidoreductase